MAVIVGSEALKQVEGEALVLARAIGQLMASKVVHARWDEDVLVDVEGLSEALRKNVYDVIVSVAAVIEISAKRRLPFLSLQDPSGVGSIVDERLEVQFADATDFGPWLK